MWYIKLFVVNHLIMIKQKVYNLNLKPLHSLQSVSIFSMPSRIRDKDILAMFNGLLALMREKNEQDNLQKFLKLKMKYSRLKNLYDKSRSQLNDLYKKVN